MRERQTKQDKKEKGTLINNGQQNTTQKAILRNHKLMVK